MDEKPIIRAMKKVWFISALVLSACAVSGYFAARLLSPPAASVSVGNGIPAVVSGGLLLPAGVPLATKDAKDLALWIQVSPATINGRPVSSGNSGTFSEMQGTGRIVLLANGTRGKQFQADGNAVFFETDIGTRGWVPSFTVH